MSSKTHLPFNSLTYEISLCHGARDEEQKHPSTSDPTPEKVQAASFVPMVQIQDNQIKVDRICRPDGA